MESEKQVIEVNGVKLEIGLRYARKIDHFKIGDKVKILIKEYSSYKSCPGIIAGFDAFTERPTIIVAYIDMNYREAALKFAHINKDSEGIEICPAHEFELQFSKADMLSFMDSEIQRVEISANELRKKKEYFLENFNKYFEDKNE